MNAELQAELDSKALKDAVWLALFLADRCGRPELCARLTALYAELVTPEDLEVGRVDGGRPRQITGHDGD